MAKGNHEQNFEGFVQPNQYGWRQLAGTDLSNTHLRRDVQKCFGFRREQIWVDLACLKMEGKVGLKLWVQPGCSPRYASMVPKCHFAGQLVRTDFGNARMLCGAQKMS